MNAKSCRGEVEEKKETEILLYSHDRNVLYLLLAGSCLLGKETSTLMRNDSEVTIARFNCSIVLGKSFIFHQWNSEKQSQR